MDLPGIIVISKLQLKTDSSGEIKQGSLSKKGLLRENGDAALKDDPRSPFKGKLQARVKIVWREPGLKTQDRRRYNCMIITPVIISTD